MQTVNERTKSLSANLNKINCKLNVNLYNACTHEKCFHIKHFEM